jgi:hypothetical protein
VAIGSSSRCNHIAHGTTGHTDADVKPVYEAGVVGIRADAAIDQIDRGDRKPSTMTAGSMVAMSGARGPTSEGVTTPSRA